MIKWIAKKTRFVIPYCWKQASRIRRLGVEQQSWSNFDVKDRINLEQGRRLNELRDSRSV